MADPAPQIGMLAGIAGELPLEWFEALLDALPTPVLLLEPETARVLYANSAADAMAGGAFPRGEAAGHHRDVYGASDLDGNPLPPEQYPSARAARGERLRGVEVDWHLGDSTRTVLVQADQLPSVAGGPSMAMLTFEDVSGLRRAEQEARAAERLKDETVVLLDTLFYTAPVGFAFFDRDLRYVRVNEALTRLHGIPADDHVGRRIHEVLPEAADSLEEALAEVLASGEPVVQREVLARTPAHPAEQTWSVSSYPIRHRSGAVLGVGSVVVDMTERARLLESERRARTRAAFLARAGEVLGASLDSDATLVDLAALAVPTKADWCAIDMVDDFGTIRRVAVRHLEPEKEALGHELFERYPPQPDAPAGVPAVIRTGQPVLYEEITDDLLRAGARDEEELRIARDLGLRSAMIVPLRSRGRVVGAMTFVYAESGRRYDDDSLSLALEVARRASVAIENASLHHQLAYIAETLQASLLPPSLPRIPGFDLAARYRAAGEGFAVGGDFYDVFPRDDDTWTIVLGDVVGKGPPAAALTALARYTARAAAHVHGSPAEVLGLLNAAIRREVSDDQFMTAVAGTLKLGDDPALTLASGGHPPAVVVRDGRAELVLAPGRLLGLDDDADLVDARVELGPGDVVVLYTDGVTDAAAPTRPLSLEDLALVVERHAGASADEIAAAVETAALADARGRPRDDMAIVVLRRLPD